MVNNFSSYAHKIIVRGMTTVMLTISTINPQLSSRASADPQLPQSSQKLKACEIQGTPSDWYAKADVVITPFRDATGDHPLGETIFFAKKGDDIVIVTPRGIILRTGLPRGGDVVTLFHNNDQPDINSSLQKKESIELAEATAPLLRRACHISTADL